MLPHENPHHFCYIGMLVCVRITAISIMAYFENMCSWSRRWFLMQKAVNIFSNSVYSPY